jgi:hypothetical protein
MHFIAAKIEIHALEKNESVRIERLWLQIERGAEHIKWQACVAWALAATNIARLHSHRLVRSINPLRKQYSNAISSVAIN